MMLNEIAAKWLGKKYEVLPHLGEPKNVYLLEGEDINDPMKRHYVLFDPLHDWGQLMTLIVSKLLSLYDICLTENEIGKSFEIQDQIGAVVESGSYPADYPKAILELVRELYEAKSK